MIRIENMTKTFATRRGPVQAIDALTLEIDPGAFVVVRGPSGSGKTTLLLALGGMQRPTQGKVLVDGHDPYALSPADRAQFRAERIGFVFQMFHLVPYLSVRENVLLAGKAAGNGVDAGKADALIEELGLTPRRHHRPGELSAGERQRAAIARALINQPALILADEPTGNLDPDNAAEVVQALHDFRKQGGTVVFVTHGTAADEHADRVIQLRDGRLVTE